MNRADTTLSEGRERPFVGRRSELALLGAALDAARSGRPRLVGIEGPPGIGKTHLIRRFLEEAGCGLPVLRASGEESEIDLAYGVADQLLGTISGNSPGAEPMAVGVALVARLGAVAEQGPALLILDDAQWADHPSLRALLFALRRLQADPVLAILALRDSERLPDGLRRLLAGEGGATLHLGGFEAAEIRELSGYTGPARLSLRGAERLRDHTDGNPLYACSLLDELTAEQLLGDDAPLPSPRSYAPFVLQRLAACPDPAQHFVAAASVLGTHTPLHLLASVWGAEDPLEPLEQAMEAGLLTVAQGPDGRQVAFTHPLVRAAVYHSLGPARRSSLHARAEAVVDSPSARLYHRIKAVRHDRDEVLSSELVAFAAAEAARGAWAAAAAHLEAASRLHPVRRHREALRLRSVELDLVAGDIVAAAPLAAGLESLPPSPERASVLGRLALVSGRYAEAEALLAEAWAGSASRSVADLLAHLSFHRLQAGDALAWAEQAGAGEDAGPGLTIAIALGLSGRSASGLRQSAPLPDPVPATTLDLAGLDRLSGRGILRLYIDDIARARVDLLAATRRRRVCGPLDRYLMDLAHLATAEYRLGIWDDAIMHAELAVTTAQDAGQQWLLAWLHALAVAPLAGRGDWSQAGVHAEAAAEAARHTGVELATVHAAIAGARLAAAAGDAAGVLVALQPVIDLRADRPALVEPGLWGWQELCIEALISTGDLDGAAEELHAWRALAWDRGQRLALVEATRLQGLLAAASGDPASARDALQAGLDLAQDLPSPFARASVQAAAGRVLRRANHPRTAASLLAAAYDGFSRLAARPYAERCAEELAGCGLTRPGRGTVARDALTPQELSVARRVASGLRNRQVAAELLLSPKTVEYHLSNVYAKLGVSSRSQLARAWRDPGDFPDLRGAPPGKSVGVPPVQPTLRLPSIGRVRQSGAGIRAEAPPDGAEGGSEAMGEHPGVVKARQYLDAFGAGDTEAMKDFFDDDIVWHVAGNHHLSGDYRGKDELFAYFATARDISGGLELIPESILASDQHTAMFTRVKGQRDGKVMDVLLAQVLRVGPDGRWTEYYALADDQASVDAFWS